jgi:hypothetical protein
MQNNFHTDYLAAGGTRKGALNRNFNKNQIFTQAQGGKGHDNK